ncbi:hypothetical protein RBA19_21750, partial [Mycobacteroides abscessus subsp. massiliense]
EPGSVGSLEVLDAHRIAVRANEGVRSFGCSHGYEESAYLRGLANLEYVDRRSVAGVFAHLTLYSVAAGEPTECHRRWGSRAHNLEARSAELV